MDKAYCEDWCIHGFLDLALCHYILIHNDGATKPFAEHQAFLCNQALEKFFKAFLIKKNKIKKNDDLKIYSHNLVRIIEALELKNDEFFCKELSVIGEEYLNSFGLYKDKINMDGIISLNFLEKYSPGGYNIFLNHIKSAYFELRYPMHHKNLTLVKMNTWVCSPYENRDIVIATIKTCKLILKYLDDKVEKLLYQNFSWKEQENSFEDPNKETIVTYLKMQELLDYIFNKSSKLKIDEWCIISS